MKKTVLITGASSGFGKETAKVFQQKGWNVIATMRAPEKEQELSALENVFITRLDVQDRISIEKAVSDGIAQFGRVDALVNNAGYGVIGVFESSTSEQVQKQYAVNVFGLMDVTRAMLPHLRENGGGVIVNISSFGGMLALPFGSLYTSSKFAVEGFSEALSHELAPFNIAVKIVEPGSVPTNFRNSHEVIRNGIPVYDPYMAGLYDRYAKITENIPKAAATEVAAAIFNAVTDNTSRLRYVVGEDAQFFIDIKQRNTEQDFVKSIRQLLIS